MLIRVFFLIFFFFKQKTAYEMRISDWSSDVCSSDLSAVLAGLALQGAIQARPSLLRHLALQGLLDLQLGAWPQPFGRQLGGAMAKAVRDVVARDDEVFAGVVTPAHDQVSVRCVGVPVIHRHPSSAARCVGEEGYSTFRSGRS